MPFVNIPDSEKQEWHTTFEDLCSYLNNLTNKLPVLVCGVNEDGARNMTNCVRLLRMSYVLKLTQPPTALDFITTEAVPGYTQGLGEEVHHFYG